MSLVTNQKASWNHTKITGGSLASGKFAKKSDASQFGGKMESEKCIKIDEGFHDGGISGKFVDCQRIN